LILLVEDNPADERLISASLAKCGIMKKVVVLREGAQVLHFLDDSVPEILLVTLDSAEVDAFDILRLVRSGARTAYLPTIVLTSLTGERTAVGNAERAIEAMRSGADDCVFKSDLTRLTSAIEEAIARAAGRREEAHLGSQGLRGMEEALRLQVVVMEAAAHPTVITGLDGTIEWVNSAFTALTQYSREEAIGRNIRLLKSGVHDGGFFKDLWDTILRGEVWKGEIVNRRKDGSLYREDQMITPVRDGRGDIRHLVAVKQDISSRVQAEAQARLSHSILSRIGNVVYVVDSEGQVRYVSPSVEGLLGYRSEELYGEGWWNRTFLDADHRDTARSSAIQVARGETKPRSKAFERGVKAQDGSLRLMLWTESTAPDNLMVRVGSDITELRQLEDQFRQAQKMEAIGQLAGGVAHDFNNLLTVINGYSALLLEGLAPGDSSLEPLAAIQKAGVRAAAITRQLLAFGRPQAIQPRIVELNAIAKDLEKMLRRLIGEDIILTAVLDPSLGRVRADPGQIEQVLINLAVNARDAMPLGGKLSIETVNVRLDESTADTHLDIPVDMPAGKYSVMSVSDTGCGMDEATKARIFEPFFTTKEPGKGTGLGLAVVHGIVKQNGAHIQVCSEVGSGTTFKIYLPHAGEPAVAAEPVSSQAMPGGNETLLMAEDEDGVRVIVRYVLTSCGYNVLEARDGVEAMKVAEAHEGPIHLLVSDVVMPNLSGRELSERLTRVRPGLKVLFLSGYTDDAVVRHGVLESRVAFLQKPFTAAGLAQKVREVLDRRN